MQQRGEKAPGQIGKNDRLNVKIGQKINNIKHNNGSKIHPQNQVIFDCFMPSTSV